MRECVVCVYSGLTSRVKVKKVFRTHLHDGPWSRVPPAQPAVPRTVTVRTYRGQYGHDVGLSEHARYRTAEMCACAKHTPWLFE